MSFKISIGILDSPMRLPWLIALAAMALMTFGVYWPGLSGGFLFDDFANLPALGRYGPVRDWDGLLRYLTSGIADPTGRPISMLSFLVDARDWPAEPWSFKRTNVLIHAVNGALLYTVLAALGTRVVAIRTHAKAAALVATAAWLLHPLWVSTVLYVIQRHAMLAALFALAGIRLWIASQDAFLLGHTARGWFLAMLAVPVCGLLAGLSKANGFLLPLLLLVLQATILSGADRDRVGSSGSIHFRLTQHALLVAPSVLVTCAIFVSGLLAQSEAYESRPWSLPERLMSQPRALFDYLYRLWIPQMDSTGIFADGFPASTGLLFPWTTLLCIIGVLALAYFGVLWYRKHPFSSAAILFFLAGHTMESSVIPLELYFEHRNYLPSVLLFWPLALWLTRQGPYRHMRAAAIAGGLLICALITLAQAQIWGHPQDLARIWAKALPDSPRAQTYMASVDLAHSRPRLTIARLSPLLSSHPDEAQFALTLLDAHCQTGRVPSNVIETVKRAIRNQGAALDVTHQWLARALTPGSTAACGGLPITALKDLVSSAILPIESSNSAELHAREERLMGLLALRTLDCQAALRAFNARIDAQSRPEHVSQQTGLLAAHCGPRAALAHLDHYQFDLAGKISEMQTPILRLRDRIMARQGYWDSEWLRLRQILEGDLAREGKAPN